MAILHGLRGIEVTICSNDEALTEYTDTEYEGDEEQEEKTVANYVQCVSGSEFHIAIHVGSSYKPTSYWLGSAVYVDGDFVGGHLLPKNQLLGRRSYMDKIEGPTVHNEATDEYGVQQLTFAEIKLSELQLNYD